MAHADRAEDRATDLESAIDVPADEQLLGGPSLKLDPPHRAPFFRGREECVGRLCRPTGIGERDAEPFGQPGPDVGGCAEVECGAVVLGGAIERECRIGFLRRESCLQ